MLTNIYTTFSAENEKPLWGEEWNRNLTKFPKTCSRSKSTKGSSRLLEPGRRHKLGLGDGDRSRCRSGGHRTVGLRLNGGLPAAAARRRWVRTHGASPQDMATKLSPRPRAAHRTARRRAAASKLSAAAARSRTPPPAEVPSSSHPTSPPSPRDFATS